MRSRWPIQVLLLLLLSSLGQKYIEYRMKQTDTSLSLPLPLPLPPSLFAHPHAHKYRDNVIEIVNLSLHPFHLSCSSLSVFSFRLEVFFIRFNLHKPPFILDKTVLFVTLFLIQWCPDKEASLYKYTLYCTCAESTSLADVSVRMSSVILCLST